jgi:hypothetical protein
MPIHAYVATERHGKRALLLFLVNDSTIHHAVIVSNSTEYDVQMKRFI